MADRSHDTARDAEADRALRRTQRDVLERGGDDCGQDRLGGQIRKTRALIYQTPVDDRIGRRDTSLEHHRREPPPGMRSSERGFSSTRADSVVPATTRPAPGRTLA